MKVFVSFDGDGIGKLAGRARLSDDVAEVRRIDSVINAGNDIFRSWATSHGGIPVAIDGDEGAVEVSAEHLPDVESLREQYAQLTGETVSVGVGIKLSESSKALLVAKLRGKAQTVLWDPDMQAELDAVTEKPESQKIADEYLNKSAPGQNQGAHAGFEGHKAPKIDRVDGKDHEQGQVIKDMINEEERAQPKPPEATHAADGLEEAFHAEASKQDLRDQGSEEEKNKRLAQLKAQLVEVLGIVRDKAQVIAQIKESDPQAYTALMDLVQGVIAMGREVMGDDPVSDKKPEPEAMAKEELDPSEKDEEEDEEEKKEEDLDKSGGPIKGVPPQNQLILPVGSQVNDRMKVRHANNETAWTKLGSGMVQGQEASAALFGMNSHPVPARQPGAK